MMMRRRRRPRPQWVYADNQLTTVNSGSLNVGSYYYASTWLLPPGRVKYLCDSKRKQHLTVKGIHLWLDFYLSLVSSTATSWPQILFYVTKAAEGQDGSANFFQAHPWTAPATPSTIATWNEWDDDGLNSFMWCHRIGTSGPPGSAVYQTQSNLEYNQLIGMKSDGENAVKLCWPTPVEAMWQPSVRIKTARRLSPGEGIIFTMMTTGQLANGMTANMNWFSRVLGL